MNNRQSLYYLADGTSIDFDHIINEAEGIQQSDLQQARKLVEELTDKLQKKTEERAKTGMELVDACKEIISLKNTVSRRNTLITDLRGQISSYNRRTPVYARDLSPNVVNDAFFGKGFEDFVRYAEKLDKEIIVGHFVKAPYLET